MDPKIMILLILLPLFLVRSFPSWSSSAPGTIIVRMRLGLRQRLQLHANALAVVGAIVALDAALRGPSGATLLLAGCSVLLLAALPLHYTGTDQGLQFGRSRFRRWTEFAVLSASRGRIRLRPVSGGRPMTLRLSETSATELEPVLCRQIWAAYRGAGPISDGSRPAPASAGQEARPALQTAQG